MREDFSLLNARAVFYWLRYFVGITFHTKNKSTAHWLFAAEVANHITSSPQVHHEITCCKYYTVDDWKEAHQEKNWGGVCCKGKGWRDGGEHRGGKNQEDEERSDGMCPGCGGEEEISSSIKFF